MRKVLLFLIFSLASSVAFCQDTTKFGIFAGLNETSVPMVFQGRPYANATQGGFSIGGVADIGLSKFLSFQPGLYYTRKGGATLHDTIYLNTGVPKNAGSDKLYLYYGEIPLNFIFHVPLAGATVFAGGGPYLALEFDSKLLFKVDGEGETYNQSPYNPPEVSDTDLGYNIIGGIRFAKGITVRVTYEKSFGTIYAGQSSAKNQGLNFSVGYFFK
ncbi:MAG: PorT family protein [Bacteroidetes bacterium]|nr:PorT family protein [Bacteroidota bacterium]